jgi:hypothetical protein
MITCDDCGEQDEVTTCAACKRAKVLDALLECTKGTHPNDPRSCSEILDDAIDTEAFIKMLKAIL